jgi:excisionase family DNA binding protein
MTPLQRRLLTTCEVAVVLGCDRRIAKQMINDGVIGSVVVGNKGSRKVPVDALESYLSWRTINPREAAAPDDPRKRNALAGDEGATHGAAAKDAADVRTA